MGLIYRAFIKIARPLFGPSLRKLLDMKNVCMCLDCCAMETFVPCYNETEDDQKECNWCIGANAGKYPHCHGIGNALLESGWGLGGPRK
jgi:hypothetical protein